jgi:hypothetical protein
LWTPDRDASGVVQSTSLAKLPGNTWTYINGSEALLDSVIESPRYPNLSGSDGSTAIVQAWGGAAWDPISQRMYLSGGGHGDSSAAETGVYLFDAASLRFSRIVNRQPRSAVLRPTSGPCGPLAFGEGWPGPNYPLSTGVPGAQHTYDGMPWIPPTTMQAIGFGGNQSGGLFYPGRARAVINLDNGAYSKLHYSCQGRDASYVMAVVDKSIVLVGGGIDAFSWQPWDMAQSEMTDWQSSGFDGNPAIPSLGKLLPSATSSIPFTYNYKAFCWLRERREVVSFHGNQTVTRVRYGQALDAGAINWSPYYDAISLVGEGAIDFVSANLQDTGTNLLCAAGAHFDAGENCIWLQANTQGGMLYKITGLDTGVWTVTKIPGTGAVATAGQGTFGRFRVATIAGVKLALRVTATTHPVQVIRIV